MQSILPTPRKTDMLILFLACDVPITAPDSPDHRPPLDHDIDNDGLIDPLEEAHGSDPLNPYSWPGSGLWPDFSEQAVASDVFGVGETLPSFTGYDHLDQEVTLSQFWGEIVLLDVCAAWCGPCQYTAEEARGLWVDYRDEGVVPITLMLENYSGQPSTVEDLGDWAEAFDLTFPVLGLSEEAADLYLTGLYESGLYEGYIPQLVLLDREHRVVGSWIGAGNQEEIAAAIEALL